MNHNGIMTVSGRLASDPEERVWPSGARKVSFRVIWNRDAKINGSWTKVTEAVNFFAWTAKDAPKTDLGQMVLDRLIKGQEVFCTGVQETSQGSDPNKPPFVAYRLIGFEPGREPRAVADARRAARASTESQNPAAESAASGDDEGLPF